MKWYNHLLIGVILLILSFGDGGIRKVFAFFSGVNITTGLFFLLIESLLADLKDKKNEKD